MFINSRTNKVCSGLNGSSSTLDKNLSHSEQTDVCSALDFDKKYRHRIYIEIIL